MQSLPGTKVHIIKLLEQCTRCALWMCTKLYMYTSVLATSMQHVPWTAFVHALRLHIFDRGGQTQFDFNGITVYDEDIHINILLPRCDTHVLIHMYRNMAFFFFKYLVWYTQRKWWEPALHACTLNFEQTTATTKATM